MRPYSFTCAQSHSSQPLAFTLHQTLAKKLAYSQVVCKFEIGVGNCLAHILPATFHRAIREAILQRSHGWDTLLNMGHGHRRQVCSQFVAHAWQYPGKSRLRIHRITPFSLCLGAKAVRKLLRGHVCCVTVANLALPQHSMIRKARPNESCGLAQGFPGPQDRPTKECNFSVFRGESILRTLPSVSSLYGGFL